MADYYIATTGSDGNSGAIGSPWATLAHALGVIAGGDRIFFRAGTYDALIHPTYVIPSGSFGSPTTIAAYNNESVTWRPTDTGTRVITLGESGAVSYLTVSGIVFDGINQSGTFSDGVKVSANCDHIVIEDFELKNIWHNGFLTEACPTLTVQRGVIHDVGRDPVAAPSGHGIYHAGDHAVFQDLELYNCAGWGFQLQYSTCHDNIVRRWNSHHNGTGGLVLSSFSTNGTAGHDNLVYNGISHSNTYGVWVGGGGSDITQNNQVYNLTIYGNASIGLRFGLAQSCLVKNIVSFGNSPNFQDDGGLSNTLSNNMFATDPGFLDAAGSNFRLQAGSPAIDAGADLFSVGVITDILLTPRPQGAAFDIGAFEYTAGAEGGGDDGGSSGSGVGGGGEGGGGSGGGGGSEGIGGGGGGSGGGLGTVSGFLFEDLHHLDIVMDESRAQWDWLTSILSVYNSAPIYSNGQYKIITDRADLPLRQVFHAGNTIPGRTEIRIGGNPLKPNQVTIQFADRNIHFTENVINIQDSASIFGAGDPVRSFDAALRGITRATEAIREGGYLLLKNQRNKREVTFATGLEGLAVEPGDRCKVGVLMTDYQTGYGGRALDGSSSHIVFDMPVTTLSGYAYELLVWHTQADTLEQRSLANAVGSGWIVGSPNLGFSYAVQPGDRWAVGISSEDLLDVRVGKVERDQWGIQTITAEQYVPVFPGLYCPDSHTLAQSLFAPPAQPRSYSLVAFPDCTLCVSFTPASVVTGTITQPGTSYPGNSGDFIPGVDISARLSGSWSPFRGSIVGDTIRFTTGTASGQARTIAAWYPDANSFDGARLVWWSPRVTPPSSGDQFAVIPRSNTAVGMRVYYPPSVAERGATVNSGWVELGSFLGQNGCVDITGTVGSLTVMLVPVSSWGVPNKSGPITVTIEAPGCDDRAFLTNPSTVSDTNDHLIYGIVLPGSVMGLRNELNLTGALYVSECCSPAGEATNMSFDFQWGASTIISSLVVPLNDASSAATITSSGTRLPATLTLDIRELASPTQQFVTLTYEGPTTGGSFSSLSKTATANINTEVSNSFGIVARFSHPDVHACFNLLPDNFQMEITEVDT
jgi:hypothetical protein